MQSVQRAACAAVFLCALLAPSTVSAETFAKGTAFPALKRRVEQHRAALEQQKQQSQKHEQEDNETNDDDDGDDDDDDQQKLAPSTPVSQGAEDVKSPEIPAPASVGASGFPELPAVSKMLDTASASLRSVEKQAKLLESQAIQTQSKNEGRLAKQKSIFEGKLHAQEQQNLGIVAASTIISSEIDSLRKGNADLKQHARDLAKKNRFMRKELQALLSSLGKAQNFITSSLTKTDDTGAEELNVLHLKATHHKPRHHDALLEVQERSGDEMESDDDDEEDDPEDQWEAFISLRSRAHRHRVTVSESGDTHADILADEALGGTDATPQDTNANSMISVLSERVQELQKEGKESSTKLRTMFVGAFKHGAKRHSALLARQKALNATRQSLLAKKSELTTAEQHLESTKQELEKRLRGFGLFLQKLGHVALAPQSEVPSLVEGLPQRPIPSAPPKAAEVNSAAVAAAAANAQTP